MCVVCCWCLDVRLGDGLIGPAGGVRGLGDNLIHLQVFIFTPTVIRHS